MFDFSRTFRGVNTDIFLNFSDIFLISPTSDPSDFLLSHAVHAVCPAVVVILEFRSTLIKNTKFVKDLLMIDAQFRFNQCNSFREENISAFSYIVLC